MEPNKLQILLHAEYLALYKTAATAHRINGLIAKIYGFCYLGREEDALRVLDELNELITRSAVFSIQPESYPKE